MMTNLTPENTVTGASVLCGHLPCELGVVLAPCSSCVWGGKRAGPAPLLLLPYFLYNSVFKQWALTAPADLSPRWPCSGVFWPTAGLASPAVCRKTDVSRPSCLLSPPPISQLRLIACCACWSVFCLPPQSLVCSLGKNTEGCFLRVLVGHWSWMVVEE